MIGLRFPEQMYATRPSASRLEFARLSDGRNLVTRKGQFYENEGRNSHRGPRYGHRCGDARPGRLGRMWKDRQARHRSSFVARTVWDDDPIVGFWKVKLVSKGNAGIPDDVVLDAGYSQWHSDGTEILNSSREPETQSFCLGVWNKIGHSHYKLNHFAISWANGALLGPANIREDVTLSHDGNTFTGTFTIDQYDQAGNLLVHLVGQIEAKRITVDTSVIDVL